MIPTHMDARHPFEVVLVPVSGIAALMQLLSGKAPSNIAATVSPTVQIIWSLLVLAGAVAATAGIAWRDEATGLYLEIAGLIGIAFGMMAYAASVVIVSPNPLSSFAAPFCLAFAGACFWRAWRCIRVIHKAIYRANKIQRVGSGDS